MGHVGRISKECLTEKFTFEQRSEGREGVRHRQVSQGEIPVKTINLGKNMMHSKNKKRVVWLEQRD